jgi:sugar phosphate isomerase/epimerase
MKLGISSYAYGWAVGAGRESDASINALGWREQVVTVESVNENNLLDAAQKFGLKLVQFGDHLPLHEFDTSRLQNLKERSQRDGIELEIGARGLTPEHLSTYIELASELNAPILRFVIDAPDYHPTPDEVVQIIKNALPQLQHTTLGIENHDRFPARVLRQMMEEIKSEHVGICLDTANSLGAGEGILEVLRELAPHTVNLHIKDFGITRVPYLMGFQIEGRAAGRGISNLTEVLQQLQPFSRCRSAVLETWVPPENNLEATIQKERLWVDASIKYLRDFSWP